MLHDVVGLTIFGVSLAAILSIRILRRLQMLRPYQLSVFFPLVAVVLIVYWQYPYQRAHLFAGLILAAIIDWMFITRRAETTFPTEEEGVHGW